MSDQSTKNRVPRTHPQRKISIQLRPPPSPARNPISEVLYISNLVRPFTVKQLKELLERTGKIKEGGFWTDRIKSKCYVQYETEAEAEATRNALHGVHWPIGNGKKLVIEYATVEDLDKAKNPAPPAQARGGAGAGGEEEERWSSAGMGYGQGRIASTTFQNQESKQERFIRIGNKRKIEEPVPQKLMDDLFLKTKATPSIYWQPLSPEEIAMKQKAAPSSHGRAQEKNRRDSGPCEGHQARFV
ncbi:hypothetical protein NQ317_008887 [Molorchus minor]|uniref:RRM domain-containing protein n=1 Tax=Molorchus minor TaxID=1323400 RepID=A0ABQ9JMQ9_9CUCU|nr:hypothetical protein NQ317_008887 [Molorchus minor]